MKLIKLTQGQFAQVDDEDYEWLNGMKWQADKINSVWYATRTDYSTGKKLKQKMHRLILNLTNPSIHVDHKDRNGLNNQRSNLRTATPSDNNANRKTPLGGGTSKYLVVHWVKRLSKWKVSVGRHRTKHYIGIFSNEIDAAKAYDKWAKHYHGEFANLNFKD